MSMRKETFILLLALSRLFAGWAGAAAELEEWKECALVASEQNDGDSFLVRMTMGEEHRIRLCFVDTSETSAGSEADRRRIRRRPAARPRCLQPGNRPRRAAR